MGSKITFRLTPAEITRCNQMLVDTLGCIDSEVPAGETVFFRNAEFVDGYEAHIAVIAAKPTPLLEVVIYDDCGTPIAGDRQHTASICQSFVFSVHGGSHHYYVEIAEQEKL